MNFIVESISNPVLGPIFALLAGILASASPCAMAAVPLVVGHIAGIHEGSRRCQLALFVLGMAIALSLTGIAAALLRQVL